MTKEFTIIIEEHNLSIVQAMFPLFKFIEIQGVNLNGQNSHHLLATPVINPLPPADVKLVEEAEQPITD